AAHDVGCISEALFVDADALNIATGVPVIPGDVPVVVTLPEGEISIQLDHHALGGSFGGHGVVVRGDVEHLATQIEIADYLRGKNVARLRAEKRVVVIDGNGLTTQSPVIAIRLIRRLHAHDFRERHFARQTQTVGEIEMAQAIDHIPPYL